MLAYEHKNAIYKKEHMKKNTHTQPTHTGSFIGLPFDSFDYYSLDYYAIVQIYDSKWNNHSLQLWVNKKASQNTQRIPHLKTNNMNWRLE